MTTDGATGPAPSRRRAGSRFGVAARIVTAVLIPVTALSLLAATVVGGGLDQAHQAASIEHQIPALNDLVALRSALNDEWALSGAEAEAINQGINPDALRDLLGLGGTSVQSARSATDGAIRATGVLSSPQDRNTLADLRRSVDQRQLDPVGINAAYHQFDDVIARAFGDRLRGLQQATSALGRGGQDVADALQTLDATNDLLAAGAAQVADLASVWFSGPGQRDSALGNLNQHHALYLDGASRLDRYAQGDVRAQWQAYWKNPLTASFAVVVRDAAAGKGVPHTPGDTVDISQITAAFKEGFGTAPLLYGLMTTVTTSILHSTSDVRAKAVAGYEHRLAEAVLLVAVAFLIALLIARSITRPLGRLQRRAQEVSDGDLDADPLGLGGPWETALVSEAINDLVSNLRLLEAKAQALAACAFDDPILEQQIPGRLGQSLHESVAVLSGSIVEREALQHDLAHQATHDALTGLCNRAAAIDALTKALARAHRAGEAVAVLYVDLDDFKRANDAHGHGVGDRILREVAARMARTVRSGDFIARLGGDEFVILTERIEESAEATLLANRLIGAVSEPIEVGRLQLSVGASVGIALALDGHEDPMQLLARADLAVCRAKQRGRSQVELYDESLQRALLERAEVEQALAIALRPERDELVLHYQPVIAADTGEIRGVEALVRWNRPGQEQWPPDRFVPIAETSNLIIDLDCWVLATAAHQLVEWSSVRELAPLYVAVNISGRHLVSESLSAHVSAVIAETAVDPTRLILEITETVLVNDLLVARRELEALRALGVRIAIDDFGTGYTSLGQLQHLPVDSIKIDRSFINELPERRDRSLVRMVTDLGHHLGVTIVAEGVETDVQLSTLRELGCDTVQGFLISRPMLPTDFADWNQDRCVSPTTP